jgi:hypothetical protein
VREENMASATKTKKDAAEAPKTPEDPRRCDATKIKPGSVASRHSHVKVVKVEYDPRFRDTIFTLVIEAGFEWDVKGANIMEAEFSFADQFENEVKQSRTDVNKVLAENRSTAMTVVYTKKPDAEKVAKELATGRGSDSEKDFLKKVEALMEGEERTMIGHHSGQFDEHQRLMFVEHGVGPRLVDTRTIKTLIVGRTKYIVK